MDSKPGPSEKTGADAREAIRVRGPFDGKWVADLTLPLRIHDLSMGGCLIEAHHPQSPGRRFTLELELPHEGWISVEAETVYSRDDYGYAVRFIQMTDDVRARLDRVLRRLHPTAAL
jgi:hypothetical protein